MEIGRIHAVSHRAAQVRDGDEGGEEEEKKRTVGKKKLRSTH